MATTTNQRHDKFGPQWSSNLCTNSGGFV